MARLSKKKLNSKFWRGLGAEPMACWKDGGPEKTGHETELLTVFGIATGLKAVKSNYDDEMQNAIVGNFGIIISGSGATEDGFGIFYAPDIVRSHIESQLMACGGAPVQFDITISTERLVKPDGSLSFAYTANVEGDETTADPLAAMREKIAARLGLAAPANQAALPAPAKGKAKKAA